MQKKLWLPGVLHVLAWAAFFIIPGIMTAEPNPPGMHAPRPAPVPHSDSFWFFFSTAKNLLLIPLFYLNVFYILPRLLPAKKYVPFILTQIVAGLAQYGYTRAVSGIIFPGTDGGPHRYAGVLAYLIVLSVAFGYHYYRESVRVEKLRKERETESLKTELQFLRWQISPHFLFNALNNMVSLARKRSDLLEPMIINLSGLMRYMLYETAEERVSLKKEAQYLESYIHLQSVRYDHVELQTDIRVPDSPEYYIEPMLLIPFVENAFKHGIDGVEAPVIRISLRMLSGELIFTVVNKCPSVKPAPVDDAHGLGLVNVAKRLSLLYDGRHNLSTVATETYEVSLKIMLT